jgi:hypothetical protein
MVCFAAAKLHTGQSSVPDKDSVGIEVVESSAQLRELLQEKPPLQFGSNRTLLGWGVCNRWRLAIRMARLF